MHVIIVGGGKVGRMLATRLEDRGENVVIIEHDRSVIEHSLDGFSVYMDDGTDADVLRNAGADNAKIVVAATGDDDTNLLVSQLATTRFGVEQVITRMNDPENESVFEDIGALTIPETSSISHAIDNMIERPALLNLITEYRQTGDIQEFEVTAEKIVGQTISDISSSLPDGCRIALVSRDGDSHVPKSDFMIEYGDHVTVIGEKADVREALSTCKDSNRSSKDKLSDLKTDH